MNRRILLIFTAIACLMPVRQVQAQVAKLYPVDEGPRDATFFAFRARLLEAVEQRDMSFLESILFPGIQNNFGVGDGGIAEFKTKWEVESPEGELWKVLTTVLTRGGSFSSNGTVFAAPYTSTNFPEQFDAWEYGVILGDNVRVREKPAVDSRIIATLSFDIVEVTDWGGPQNTGERRWATVKLAGGRQGYVAEEHILSPMGYRAVFSKRDGKWLMSALVAGD